MKIIHRNIDGGRAFDWGKASEDYAKFRDIYPDAFYQYLADLKLCISGQDVLDMGTGTGVLPRNMYRFGANWTGTDISAEQIAQAKRLSAGMNIHYEVRAAENLGFPDNSFDVITACQCYWYFDHEQLAPQLARMLKPGGRYVMVIMNWLPFEDKIAGASEKLVLKYNPDWSGCNDTVHPVNIHEAYSSCFEIEHTDEFLLDVPFTRETWNGRIRACRGIGASLSPEETAKWEAEHLEMLRRIAEEHFTVQHYAAIAVLKVRK